MLLLPFILIMSAPTVGVAPMQTSSALNSTLGPPPMLVRPGLNSPLDPLEPVEQGVGDSTVSAVSLREISAGLEEPGGFGRLFRVPGRSDLLMRASGGLYAVFPQSVYVAGENGGFVAVIPNNTVFYIGQPALLSLGTPGRTVASTQADATSGAPEDLRTESARQATAPAVRVGSTTRTMTAEQVEASASAARRASQPDQTGVATIVNDANYRAARLRELLRVAAAADASAGRPD